MTTTDTSKSIFADLDSMQAFIDSGAASDLKAAVTGGFLEGAIFNALAKLGDLNISWLDTAEIVAGKEETSSNEPSKADLLAELIDMLVPSDYSRAAHAMATDAYKAAMAKNRRLPATQARVAAGETRISQLRTKVGRAILFAPHVIDELERMFVDSEPLVRAPAKTVEEVLRACNGYAKSTRVSHVDGCRAVAKAAVDEALEAFRSAATTSRRKPSKDEVVLKAMLKVLTGVAELVAAKVIDKAAAAEISAVLKDKGIDDAAVENLRETRKARERKPGKNGKNGKKGHTLSARERAEAATSNT